MTYDKFPMDTVSVVFIKSGLVTVIVKLVVAFNDMVMRPGGGCRSYPILPG